MKCIKYFDITLSIDNLSLLTNNPDINDTLINILSNKYVDKCYQNCFILVITKIVNRSLFEFDQNDLNCGLQVFIQFKAECLIFNPGEMLLDTYVFDIINNNEYIITQNESNNVITFMKNNDYYRPIIEKNMNIPILVGCVKYPLGLNKLSINTLVFIPKNIINNTSEAVYKIGKITDNIKQSLNECIIQYITDELDKSKTLNMIKYFTKFVYPYKKHPNSSKKTKSILSLDFDDKMISFKYESDISDGLITIVNDKNIDFIDSTNNTELILYNILLKYYNYIKMINDLSIKYNSEKSINESKHILNIYSDNKI